MPLESIDSVNSINNIDGIQQEYPRLLVDKELFETLEDNYANQPNEKKTSKAARRKANAEMLYQKNIFTVTQTYESSLEQQIIDSDLRIIEAQIREYYTGMGAGATNSSSCIYAIKHAQARYLIQRGTPEALATLDRLNLRPYI